MIQFLEDNHESLDEHDNNYPISFTQPNHKQDLTKMIRLCRWNHRFVHIIQYESRADPPVLEKLAASESTSFEVTVTPACSVLCPENNGENKKNPVWQ